MSIVIAGIQVDIQTAIVGKSLEYIHYYGIQANIFGSDLNDHAPINSPCTPNPCENGGTCQIGLSRQFSCFCRSGYDGKKISKSKSQSN